MHGELAEKLFAAFRARDVAALSDLLSPDSTWELCGRSALSGIHTGPKPILGVLQRLIELRPIRPEAYDVTASEYHAVLMTRLVAEGLDSDHAIIVVAGGDGRLARAFHYVFDLYAFDAYFDR